MENIFYVAVIVLSVAFSVWAIVMMITTSPTLQELRKNRKLDAIAKKHEEGRAKLNLNHGGF